MSPKRLYYEQVVGTMEVKNFGRTKQGIAGWIPVHHQEYLDFIMVAMWQGMASIKFCTKVDRLLIGLLKVNINVADL